MTLEDLYRLLRTGHVQAQGIVETIEHPLVVLDQGMTILEVNSAFLRTFEVERDDTCGESLFALGNGQWDIPELRRLLQEVIPKAQAVTGYEVTHTFEQLGPRVMLVSARRLLHPDSNSRKLLVEFEDITERRRVDQSKDNLVSESQHRVKNLLTVVRALAQKTDVEGQSAQDYRNAFLGRLDALTEAQELSALGDGTTSIAALVQRTLKPFEEQAHLHAGDEASISAAIITPLCMILHELSVNAAKYGALSVPDGEVHVSWEVEEPEGGEVLLLLRWREANGPPVTATKTSGFGTRLIKFAAHGELGGNADLQFEPDGLRALIKLPLKDAD